MHPKSAGFGPAGKPRRTGSWRDGIRALSRAVRASPGRSMQNRCHSENVNLPTRRRKKEKDGEPRD
jgi:hypothetical protein